VTACQSGSNTLAGIAGHARRTHILTRLQTLQMQEQARIGNLKRVIESLPLETSAVTTAAPHLNSLSSAQFATLLKELASDNHAFRCAAWEHNASSVLTIYQLACGMKGTKKGLTK